MTYSASVQIHQAQIRVRIALRSIDLDCASDPHLYSLREHDLGEGVDVEFFGVRGEELTEETFECDAAQGGQCRSVLLVGDLLVYLGVRVVEIEIYVDHAL